MSKDAHQWPRDHDAVEAAAAAWLARRDRGFSPDDEAEFALWRYSDPRHAAAVERIQAAWSALDALHDFRPEARAHPDPDLLVCPKRENKRRGRTILIAMAFAAAAMTVVLVRPRFLAENNPPPRQAIVHPGPERMLLEDGSVVELNAGANAEVRFTATERSVILKNGEAAFSVAKDALRPFVVTAGAIAVRAVGTTFSVAIGDTEVAVIVTEGRVRLEQTPKASTAGALRIVFQEVGAGQRAVVMTAGDASARELNSIRLTEITPAEVERMLTWQRMRLEFVELPLGQVVTEFNRYNRQQLAVADAETGALLVGGSFRAENVEAFVRLLESSFGVTAQRQGNTIVLSKTR